MVRTSATVVSLGDVLTVLDQVPGQDAAMTFLRGAAERPHHAYVFAGPEGSGKSLAARAFAASLLCANGGCGECRDCRLALRDVAAHALELGSTGAAGALEAADAVIAAAAEHKKGLGRELDAELAPFLDEKGRPEEAYRGSIRRIETRFHRRERRAERDHLDRVLMAASSLLRAAGPAGTGLSAQPLWNRDGKAVGGGWPLKRGAGLAAMEGARAALADDVNLNPRLVVERAFLQLSVEER